MTTDAPRPALGELARLAKAALDIGAGSARWYSAHELSGDTDYRADAELLAACSPAVILQLVALASGGATSEQQQTAGGSTKNFQKQEPELPASESVPRCANCGAAKAEHVRRPGSLDDFLCPRPNRALRTYWPAGPLSSLDDPIPLAEAVGFLRNIAAASQRSADDPATLPGTADVCRIQSRQFTRIADLLATTEDTARIDYLEDSDGTEWDAIPARCYNDELTVRQSIDAGRAARSLTPERPADAR